MVLPKAFIDLKIKTIAGGVEDASFKVVTELYSKEGDQLSKL